MQNRDSLRLFACLTLILTLIPSGQAARVTGSVADADTGIALPARIYIIDSSGQNHFVQSSAPEGTALAYREEWVPMPDSQDEHTTISAHPFQINLAPGNYAVEVFRGKEYFPFRRHLEVSSDPIHLDIHLRRWIDLGSRNWYSGETHVHRRHFELPNVMMAEDLNITFPVTFWTTSSDEAPHKRPSTLRHPPSPFGPRIDHGTDPILIDKEHVVIPRNTEYEIFSVGKKRHTLGAVFVINHKSLFKEGMPPVKKIANLAHQEGALLDLDKHSWPWAFMLAPVAGVDLFELSNNSVWRTKFGFTRSGEPANYMGIPTKNGHLTEAGWLDYGFQSYYALLNCGLRMTPTAGTASGVHPVPLGFSRVYVHCQNGFSPESWLAGLKYGRSFVTNGPMLFATVNDRHPSSHPEESLRGTQDVTITAAIHSANPVRAIEVVVNGDIVSKRQPINQQVEDGSYMTTLRVEKQIKTSSWIIVRCFTNLADKRGRFAHSAPFYVSIPNKPIKPKRVEKEFLSQRMREEIARNKNLISAAALAEFKEALEFYSALATR